MALHHAVLALLDAGPRHGYDLKSEFEAMVGPQFGPLNVGHLYQLLDRLVRDGLAQTHREPQDARPDRLVHTLTDKGRAELADWLNASARPSAGYRDDFFLKIAAARRVGDAALLHRVVDQRRSVLLQELRNLAALRAQRASTTYDDLLAGAAELQTRGLLDLLDRIDVAVPRLLAEEASAGSGTAQTLPDEQRRNAS